LDGALVALESELGELQRETIAKDPFVLAAPLDHPLAQTTHDALLSDMRNASVLLLEDGHCFRDQDAYPRPTSAASTRPMPSRARRGAASTRSAKRR
jgi:DNA-binding transcriptional LysR family regulator